MRFLLCLFLLSTVYLPPASAYNFYDVTRKKQVAKDAKRWSLGEWLAQKNRIELMDMWLMFNAPSPYEFYLSVDTSTIEQSTLVNDIETNSQNFRNYRVALGAFVTAVGLYGEYETSDEELEQWKALFMLRLLGSSDQSTNLTAHYGLMNQDFNDDPTQYQVGGGRLTLYFLKAFAITGLYEAILNSTSEQDIESEGRRIEAGAHIEYGALRIYGSWYEETMELTDLLSQQRTRKRTGILFGTRLYF